jgi:hypothetical protein
MAFQGEYFIDRYGKAAVMRTPPLRRMLDIGVPVGAGTDATRVASYNPWVSLYWLVSGRTLGGTQMYGDSNRLERSEALRLWTQGSSWFSSEQDKKGTLEPGKYADLAVLSKDLFSIPEEEIKNLSSVLTIVGGRIVYGADAFSKLSPPIPPASPDWSPATRFNPPANTAEGSNNAFHSLSGRERGCLHDHGGVGGLSLDFGLGPLGCACFAI